MQVRLKLPLVSRIQSAGAGSRWAEFRALGVGVEAVKWGQRWAGSEGVSDIH